jgi:hypothetical protein
MSSCMPAAAAAAADSWTNFPDVVAKVLFVAFARVGWAMTLPGARTLSRRPSRCSAQLDAREKKRGTAITRSAGNGRKELVLVRGCCCSMQSASAEVSVGWRLRIDWAPVPSGTGTTLLWHPYQSIRGTAPSACRGDEEEV